MLFRFMNEVKVEIKLGLKCVYRQELGFRLPDGVGTYKILTSTEKS